MLPPHPHPHPPQQHPLQHRRLRPQEAAGCWSGVAAGDASGSDGSTAGDDMSPPPCKLRRTRSILRTKSVATGLDQVLSPALASCEAAVMC
jgi:hypothetical protein